MTKYTDEELKDLGRRVLAQRERDKERTKAVSQALKVLKEAHPDEYQAYLIAALREG